MGKHAKSIDKQILDRIKARGPGAVFTPADFLDLGSRNAVGQALFRNVHSGIIRQLARGLYDYPRRHPRLGVLMPSVDEVAAALKGRDVTRLQPAGGQAANILGLSTQIPARAVYLTDGRSRKVQLGRQVVILKKTTPRQMATAGRISGTVIQALRWLGQRHVDDKVVNSLRQRLSNRDKKNLLNDLRYAPAWISDVLRRVADNQDS